MKKFVLALSAFVLMPVMASAQEYTLSDDGMYTLPSGSVLGCVTVEEKKLDHAFCTMQLKGGDSQKEFPQHIVRSDKRFVVIDEIIAKEKHLPVSDAWTDCPGNCITSKNPAVKRVSAGAASEPFIGD